MDLKYMRTFVVDFLIAYMLLFALLLVNSENVFLSLASYSAILVVAALAFGRTATVRERISAEEQRQNERKGRSYYGRGRR